MVTIYFSVLSYLCVDRKKMGKFAFFYGFFACDENLMFFEKRLAILRFFIYLTRWSRDDKKRY